MKNKEKLVNRIMIVAIVIVSMCVSSFATQYYFNATQIMYDDGKGGTTVAAALNDLRTRATAAKAWKDGFDATTVEATNVLSNITAYKVSKSNGDVTATKLTGTMVDNGAGGGSITPGSSYTLDKRLLQWRG